MGDPCQGEVLSRAAVGRLLVGVEGSVAGLLERCELGLGEPEQVTPPFLPAQCFLVVIPPFFLCQFSAQIISGGEDRCAGLRDLATLEQELEV